MRKPDAIRTVRQVTERVIVGLRRALGQNESARRTQIQQFERILHAHAEAIIAAFNEPAVPLPPSVREDRGFPPYDPAPGSLKFLSHEP